MEQIYTQIRQYIDENRQPMLNLWRELVNTESGTLQIDGVTNSSFTSRIAPCKLVSPESTEPPVHSQ